MQISLKDRCVVARVDVPFMGGETYTIGDDVYKFYLPPFRSTELNCGLINL
jgi:hypothetical protein